MEKGASPPNSRSEDQGEGGITTKYQVRRSGKSREHHPKISNQKIRAGSITTKYQVLRSVILISADAPP